MVLALTPGPAYAVEDYIAVDTAPLSDSIHHWRMNHGRDRDDPLYAPEQIVEIADNMLRYQNSDGGWPKDLDWMAKIPYETVKEIGGRGLGRSTFDNRSTYTHVQYLARVHAQTQMDRHRNASQKGLQYILDSQHKSGGWRGADVDGITFNDDVMTGIMNLLLNIREGAPEFDWISDETRVALDAALDRAIDATLKCQILIEGRYTGWCQQHSHDTFAPIKARTYELPSVCPAETTSILRVLMRLSDPDETIHARVRSAVEWMKASAIHGVRLERVDIEPVREKYHTITQDRVIVEDPDAPPIWTRFYELETNRPFFCNRDGIIVYSLAEVALERRTGYGWYGSWPAKVIDVEYPAWEAKHRK